MTSCKSRREDKDVNNCYTGGQCSEAWFGIFFGGESQSEKLSGTRLSHLHFLQVRTKTCLPSIWLFPKRPSPREIEIVGFSIVAKKEIGQIMSAFEDLNFTIFTNFTTFNIVYCLPRSQLSTRMYGGLIVVGWKKI